MKNKFLSKFRYRKFWTGVVLFSIFYTLIISFLEVGFKNEFDFSIITKEGFFENIFLPLLFRYFLIGLLVGFLIMLFSFKTTEKAEQNASKK